MKYGKPVQRARQKVRFIQSNLVQPATGTTTPRVRQQLDEANKQFLRTVNKARGRTR